MAAPVIAKFAGSVSIQELNLVKASFSMSQGMATDRGHYDASQEAAM
jgi:hypothetical protein